jgi:hypothetical protein
MEKEIFEYLGVKADDIKSIDDFKACFDKAFVRTTAINQDSEFVKPILGRYFGEQEVELKRMAKAYAVDIESDEFKSAKKVTDKYDLILKKAIESSNNIIKDLEGKVGQGNDEKVKTLETKYEKLKREKAEIESLLSNTTTEYEGFKQKAANDIKGIKLGTLKQKDFSSIKFKSDISEIEKKGFFADIHDRYNFDLDETENLVVTTKEGKRIPSAKTTGTFKTAQEILEEEAVKSKVYMVNSDGGKPAAKPIFTTTANPAQASAMPTRKVAARMG